MPWLFDTLSLRQGDAQTTFDTYVRANSVLLAPGEAGTNQVSRWKRWGGPWFPEHWLHRVCPVCATDPDRGKALVWRLPTTLTTGEVSLPDRTVHAGVWFRLLRSLLDEVSLALTTRSTHGRTT